jgi:hypothetical protein
MPYVASQCLEVPQSSPAISTKLLVLRYGRPLFEYWIKANEEDGSLVAEAHTALALFRRLNPSIGLLDPKISIKFERCK